MFTWVLWSRRVCMLLFPHIFCFPISGKLYLWPLHNTLGLEFPLGVFNKWIDARRLLSRVTHSDLETCSCRTLNSTLKQQWHFHNVCRFEKLCLVLPRHTPPFPPCGESGWGGNAAQHQKGSGSQEKECWPWFGFLDLAWLLWDKRKKKKKKEIILLSWEWLDLFSWGLGVSYVLVGAWEVGETARLGACSGLQVSRDPAMAKANLLHCLWELERKSLDFVQPGEPPLVAGQKILAYRCEKATNSLFWCHFTCSSTSPKSALFKHMTCFLLIIAFSMKT